MKIAYVVYLFNRSDHSVEVIKSLIDNNIEEVIVFLDKPKTVSDGEQQHAILSYIRNVKDISIKLVVRPYNYGLALNIRLGLNEVFESGYEAAVVLEDDCVLEKNGKEFFELGLVALETNKKIRSLCGYLNKPHSFVFEPDSNLLQISRFNTWGWATWADRWKDYDPDLRGLVYKEEKKCLKIIDYSPDLDRYCSSPKYLNREVDIWSINWILTHFTTNTFCIYPYESVIRNIGFDGTGKNCTASDVFLDVTFSTDEIRYDWHKLNFFIENNQISEDFMIKNSQEIYPPY